MKWFIYIFFSLLLWNCISKKNNSKEVDSTKESAEIITEIDRLKMVDFEGFTPYLEKQNDTTYVINFWATWCKPCVEELPAFERLHKENKNKKLKVLLVSLDFPSQIEKQLVPFIKKRNLQPEVIVLNDPDTDSWIPKIATTWSGAIPATYIYKSKNSRFYEKGFTYESLIQTLKNF